VALPVGAGSIVGVINPLLIRKVSPTDGISEVVMVICAWTFSVTAERINSKSFFMS
jgi:hypothetical protein